MSLMSIDVNSDSNEGKGRRLLEKISGMIMHHA